MALEELGIEHQVIGVSEIDNNAIQIYNKIHGEAENFGDITKIKNLPPCDFLHVSSPCQNFSRGGGTRDGIQGKKSKLLLEFLRLIENYYQRDQLPIYISFENVSRLKTKYVEDYKLLTSTLEKCGYNIYDNLLSAQYFGNPTNRERFYLIGIRKDLDKGNFQMPQNQNLTALRLRDFVIRKEVDKIFYWNYDVIFHPSKDKTESYNTVKKEGWLETPCGRINQSNRVFDVNGFIPSINTTAYFYIRDNGNFRRLTAEELWLISGYSRENYEKIKNDFSDAKIVKAIGNSIPLGPLKAIYFNLFYKGGK